METKHPLVSFHVNQKDIDEGCRMDGYACAVARSISKKVMKGFYVFSDAISFHKNISHSGAVPLPPKVIAFISDFDNGRPTKPFSFRMRIPKKFLK